MSRSRGGRNQRHQNRWIIVIIICASLARQPCRYPSWYAAPARKIGLVIDHDHPLDPHHLSAAAFHSNAPS
eukprot:CAMPEP_0195013046 /NCGR_PEP_ID=MMETSP0326_2-20130528/12312_1 /TAXON_ID=2866 ORGANISM="Crypthecodinium cohnii, Strain Seligo" /NCGR_SAMPLE_ID=MMETSP0326_2 /ASSEMBLY_ACC=CAM_ASM_000348 /LENGTH=70 /DNA_ID=CAMNT_0040022951 /DNA_START=73 /DNA_END=282 /DNA_ORIENTATION=-